MKYTVVIQQPVPETVRPELQQLLSERFSLTPEQAAKLAARKGGRLMKPTGRERAGVLLEIYQSVGAQVQLEEVDDNPAPESAPEPEPQRLVAKAAPETPSEWSAPSDDFWSSLPAPELQGSPLPPLSSSMVESGVAEPVKLSEVASSNLDAGWADFSSLSVQSAPAPEVPAPEVPADTVLQSPQLSAAPAPQPISAPRQPLAQRLTLPVLLPLALLTALSLLTAGLGLSGEHSRQLGSESAAVASTLAQTLSSDRETAERQVGRLVKSNGAGFVRVQYPSGTIFQSNEAGLEDELNKWLAHPTGQDFRSSKGNFVVRELSVYGGGDERRVKASAAGETPLYRILVGTPVHGTNPLALMLPLLLAGLLAMLLGWWLVQRAVRSVVAPINRLVQAADAISMGDLRQTVSAEANDEVGDLAQALERMRLSLDAAMERLRRRRARG